MWSYVVAVSPAVIRDPQVTVSDPCIDGRTTNVQIEMLQLASMEEDIADAELSLRAYLEGLQEVDTQQPLGFSGWANLHCPYKLARLRKHIPAVLHNYCIGIVGL